MKPWLRKALKRAEDVAYFALLMVLSLVLALMLSVAVLWLFQQITG